MAIWQILLKLKKMQQHKYSGLPLSLGVSLGVLLISYGIGSASISMGDAFRVLLHKLFGTPLPQTIQPSTVSILWSIRLPRVLMAFFVGGALSVSGAVMQSVLQNPLASSYTLGVSSGASLGAAIALAFLGSVPVLGRLSMPVFGFGFGVLTVFAVIAISSRLDRNVQSSTIILFGMVISLFVNALLTLVESLNHEYGKEKADHGEDRDHPDSVLRARGGQGVPSRSAPSPCHLHLRAGSSLCSM